MTYNVRKMDVVLVCTLQMMEHVNYAFCLHPSDPLFLTKQVTGECISDCIP